MDRRGERPSDREKMSDGNRGGRDRKIEEETKIEVCAETNIGR